MDEQSWTRWIMQTARSWSDISPVVRETGVEKVDGDHRRLTEYALELNQLIERMNREMYDLDCIRQQTDLLKKLYEYTVDHFSREEDILERYQIPKIEIHKQQHARILTMLTNVLEDFEAGRISVTMNLKLAILEWVVNHVNNIDFHSFTLENLQKTMDIASEWSDIQEIVRSTGISHIDNDHKDIAICTIKVNQVIDSYSKKDEPQTDMGSVSQAIKEQYDCAQKHFDWEEEFILNFRISGYEAQKREHDKFLESLQEYLTQLNAGDKRDLLDRVRSTGLGWLVNHINKHDYNVFCKTDWITHVFDRASRLEDVASLVKKTGIAEVDEDHIKLVDMTLEINQLLDKQGESERTIRKMGGEFCAKLYAFAKEHFSREEHIMKQKELPSYQAHHAEHQRLLGMIHTFQSHLNEGRIGLSTYFKSRVLHWWVNHTNGTDIDTFVETGAGDGADVSES